MRIKPKFEYECIYFNGTNKEEIIKLFEQHRIRVLEWTPDSYEYMNNDYNYETRFYHTIYYVDRCYEPRCIDIDNGVYVWVDENDEINCCRQEYLDENFEIIKE